MVDEPASPPTQAVRRPRALRKAPAPERVPIGEGSDRAKHGLSAPEPQIDEQVPQSVTSPSA